MITLPEPPKMPLWQIVALVVCLSIFFAALIVEIHFVLKFW
jgi:hypothetical protein